MIPPRFEWRQLLASAVAYAGLTMIVGRRVVDTLGTLIASDPGDPLLTAAILSWNAAHVPWTEAWYQFPIFHPTPDVLTLSEHLLGVSVIAAPIEWLTGSPLIAYNATVLLSYPLCGVAMYALVWRLTKSAPAAFLAGLAYAFAPFRASHLPHIQMLISFWMPVALLGLHAYLETRRRRWLAVFAASWALQGAANGYYLVYFTLVVALWVAWFLVARRRWRDLAAVLTALLIGALPLAPILYRYLTSQGALGLSRGLGEINDYSADIAAVLCAPSGLTFWGWLRVACAAEGELFAGGALIALCIAGVWLGRQRRAPLGGAPADDGRRAPLSGVPQHERRSSLVRVLVLRLILAVAVIYGAVTMWTLVAGPWSIQVPFRASASSADKPASVTLFFLLAALVLSRWFHDVIRRGFTSTFYLLCAASCWVLAWGPFPRFFGEAVLYQAPYGWLLPLPGAGALRAPARLWMMVALCLTVFMGIVVARLLAGRTREAVKRITILAAVGLLADGWTAINVAAPPLPIPTTQLTGKTVLLLPIGETHPDIATVYNAVTQRFRSINGYSGYEPPYYEALRTLSDAGDERLFAPFVSRGEVQVLVRAADKRLRGLVERQPGSQLVAGGAIARYRIPQRDIPPVPTTPRGVRLPVVGAASACSPERVGLLTDGERQPSWVCGVRSLDQAITVDLGRPSTVGAVVQRLGTAGTFFPRHLVIESSLDGQSWTPAWEGSPAASVLHAAMASPRDTALVTGFPPREARYVRLRQLVRTGNYMWSIAELEVWTGGS